MSAANFTESEWMKWAFTTTAMGTRPTAWYVGLHTADPGDTGASELTDSGYSRQSVTFTQTDNQVTSSNSQTFPAIVDASVSIGYVSIWDAATTGNCLWTGALSLAKTFAIADVPKFGTGEIILSVE